MTNSDEFQLHIFQNKGQMGILEWKKQSNSGSTLVPMESGNPQQRGFRILNGDTGLITFRGLGVLFAPAKS